MAYKLCTAAVLLLLVAPHAAAAIPDSVDTAYGDQMIRAYLADQVRQIRTGWLADTKNLEDWKAQLPQRRQELREMLGLEPLPERTPLKVTVTGTVEHEAFTVEKLHFQSMPGMYVTANLYVPKDIDESLPGVLYVNGHATRRDGDVAFGSKAAYQRHPAWYARHGYVALIIDTIQLDEIEGVHHGTYRMDRWWWWNRGYTPLGVEVWNGMRALDYLETRPEVDAERLTVTGRSGGGGYSWFLAALDDRIVTSVPTAGITDLKDYVVDARIAGHCDCMVMVNTERWDFPMVAALAAPRPILLANGDHDPLFGLDGINRLFDRTRQVYALYGAMDRWQKLIVDAPHADIPPLRQGTYQWMHRRLKGRELRRTDTARDFFDPAQLKVFDELPEDAINKEIDEHFVRTAPTPDVPATTEAWQTMRRGWRQALMEQSFGGWPDAASAPAVDTAYTQTGRGLQLTALDFESQPEIPLRLWVVQPEAGNSPERWKIAALGQEGWQQWLSVLRAAASDEMVEDLIGEGAAAVTWPTPNAGALEQLRRQVLDSGEALVVFAPRGVGPTTWSEREPGYEVRRSFMLVGQTRDGMRVWDVRRAVQALQKATGGQGTIALEGRGVMAGVALYASIFEPGVRSLDLFDLPVTHREGPILLNVRKIFDMPQALGMAAAENREITLHESSSSRWTWPRELVHTTLDQAGRLRFGGAGSPWLTVSD